MIGGIGKKGALEVDIEPTDEGEEAGPSLNDMGAMRAAKQLCAALGVDSSKAGAVDAALKAHYEACTG